jgi:hypothetical protein
MKKVEVLCDEVNGVVVQVEGRSFPGLVLQGDQLFELVSLAARLEPQHDRLRELIIDYYEWFMEHGGNPPTWKGLSSEDIIRIIRNKFEEAGAKTVIPLLRPRGDKITFEAECIRDGINVDNLGNERFLPWSIFSETVLLLRNNNGRAIRGDAHKYRLGGEGLPLDSVEGNIASKVYGKKIGDTVFRRITPIACILIWAGICKSEPGELVLRSEYVH